MLLGFDREIYRAISNCLEGAVVVLARKFWSGESNPTL